jgi:hypothetical protein
MNLSCCNLRSWKTKQCTISQYWDLWRSPLIWIVVLNSSLREQRTSGTVKHNYNSRIGRLVLSFLCEGRMLCTTSPPASLIPDVAMHYPRELLQSLFKYFVLRIYIYIYIYIYRYMYLFIYALAKPRSYNYGNHWLIKAKHIPLLTLSRLPFFLIMDKDLFVFFNLMEGILIIYHWPMDQ